jgi:monofunctional biosynthetic peptidoglycan transglycosylase
MNALVRTWVRRFFRFFWVWNRSLLWKLPLLAGLIGMTPVVLWRFIDPPLTALMVKRLWQGAWGDAPMRFHHDAVSIDDISPQLVLAVIASEDQEFMDHFGFDWDAIQNALRHNEKHKRKRGGSTISQQTAKNVFLWEQRSWVRKGLEVPYTFAIELLWGKRRILEAYLNCVEFGPGIYGAEAAAQYYWHIPASKLNASQAALLAATLPSPRRNNPGMRTGFLIRRSTHARTQVQYLPKRQILSELGLRK